VPFWQHYCHLVWGTKLREPLINEEIARVVKTAARDICNDHRATLHAIGIMPDHVHLAVSIPPSLAISEFVRAVKGQSSFELNKVNRVERLARFRWQAEYAALSFGQRALTSVVAYVNNQATHHAENNLWPSFEILESIPPRKRALTPRQPWKGFVGS
jgi:putative transposase